MNVIERAAFIDSLVGRLFHLIDDGVVQRILVLLQPIGQIIRHGSRIMDDGEVGVLVRSAGLWLLEGRGLAQMIQHEFLFEGLIGGFGEERLFLENGQNACYK